MPKLIIAYDGSPHSRDALALGSFLAAATGARPALAHVHRADPADRSPSSIARGREAFLRREGERLLERAAETFDGNAERHAIAGTTTARGLRELAEREGADIIVFGSAHDRPAGRVHPGSAVRRLLHSGSCAIALAPAGLGQAGWDHSGPVRIVADDEEGSARRTAEAFRAGGFSPVLEGDARRDGGGRSGLLVIGSPGAATGRVMTSAAAEQEVDASAAPVIVLARGVALSVAQVSAQAA